MSPSSVSRLVQRLEEAVGHKLLQRDNRTVLLTSQGEAFREYALDAVATWDEMQRNMQASSERLVGSLRLFASVTASISILPDVLSRFRQDYPEIHIQLETGYAIDAMQRLAEGCDVVVAGLSLGEEANLIKNIVTSTPIVAVATPELAGQLKPGREPDSNEWASMPLVLPGFGQVRASVDDWLQGSGIKPNIYSEVDGHEAILSLVALGCGVGFVPRLVLESSSLRGRVVAIDDLTLGEFHVGFCTRPKQIQNSAIIRAFWSSI